jgi:hypothetical protein
MKKFSQLKEKDKLLMTYHDGNVNIRDMARSICFEELIVDDILIAGLYMQIVSYKVVKKEKMHRTFLVDNDNWFSLGVDCVVLPYDEENKLWVQELLYAGTMMRNQAINNKVRNLFNSLELRAHADSAGYVKF